MTINTAPSRGPRSGRRAPLALLAAIATTALSLGACDELRRQEMHRNALAVERSNPEIRHPIGFAARNESLDVEVPPGTEGLSPNQHTDVYRFMQRFKREATGRLVIVVPGGVRDRASLAHALEGIQRHVVDGGVDYRVQRARRHDPRVDGAPAIRLAYQRPVAVPPSCDHWEEDVGRNEERITYPNWGCATQRNLAVMLDNARDYRQPQGEDPRSGERRSASWSAYAGSGAGKSEASDDAKKAAASTTKK